MAHELRNEVGKPGSRAIFYLNSERGRAALSGEELKESYEHELGSGDLHHGMELYPERQHKL